MLARAHLHDVAALARVRDPWSVTIYGHWTDWLQQRSPSATAAAQIRQVASLLAARAAPPEVIDAVTDRLRRLVTHRRGAGSDYGLAIFATPRLLAAFALPTKVEPMVRVGREFLVGPIAVSSASALDACVVTISASRVRVVRVEPPEPALVDLPGMPRSLDDIDHPDLTGDRNTLARLRVAEDPDRPLRAYLAAIESALTVIRGRSRTVVVVASAEPLHGLHHALVDERHLPTLWLHGNHDDTTPARLRELVAPLTAAERRHRASQEARHLAEYHDRSLVALEPHDLRIAARQSAIDLLLLDPDALASGVGRRGARTWDEVEMLVRACLTSGGRLAESRRGELSGRAAAAILRFPVTDLGTEASPTTRARVRVRAG
jgi:hypothetical protein